MSTLDKVLFVLLIGISFIGLTVHEKQIYEHEKRIIKLETIIQCNKK